LSTLFDKFMDSFTEIIGETLWSVRMGEDNSSHFFLDIGRRLERREPLTHRNLTDNQRNFEGEFRLFIDCSPWRIGKGCERLCDSFDCDINKDLVKSTFEKVLGHFIVSVNYDSQENIMSIDFDNGIFLEWLIDAQGYKELGNFSFYIYGSTYSIDGECKLSFQSKENKEF